MVLLICSGFFIFLFRVWCFGSYPRLPTAMIILPTATHTQVYLLEKGGDSYTTYPQLSHCFLIYPHIWCLVLCSLRYSGLPARDCSNAHTRTKIHWHTGC